MLGFHCVAKNVDGWSPLWLQTKIPKKRHRCEWVAVLRETSFLILDHGSVSSDL